jgi:hypothetical protein
MFKAARVNGVDQLPPDPGRHALAVGTAMGEIFTVK